MSGAFVAGLVVALCAALSAGMFAALIAVPGVASIVVMNGVVTVVFLLY